MAPHADHSHRRKAPRCRGTCAVIGCGTAGPAAAALLARQGWRVVIFERATELSPVGAGLLLQPVGLSVLQEIGVLDQTLSLGSRVERLRGRTVTGRPVLDVSYGELGEGYFGLGVQRSMLLDQLLGAATREGVEVRLGVDVERLETNRQVWLHERASREHTRTRRHGPFDLVVLGSGARSGLRSHVSPQPRENPYPWGALWMMADLEVHELRADIDASMYSTQSNGAGRVLDQVYDSTTRMIGFLPSGRATPDAPERVSIFWSIRATEIERLRRLPFDGWRIEACALAQSVLAESIDVDRVCRSVASGVDLIPATYMDVVCEQLIEGRVVLIGDVGHAMSPQLGLGANLALLDASTLAMCLDHEHDIDRALGKYEQTIRGTHRYYGTVSRLLTPVFQSDEPVVGMLRDMFYHAFGRVPPVRKEMLRALVGARRGWFKVQDPELLRLAIGD